MLLSKNSFILFNSLFHQRILHLELFCIEGLLSNLEFLTELISELLRHSSCQRLSTLLRQLLIASDKNKQQESQSVNLGLLNSTIWVESNFRSNLMYLWFEHVSASTTHQFPMHGLIDLVAISIPLQKIGLPC